MYLLYDSDLQIEIDTAHFKGNFPASCVIEGKIDIRSPSHSALKRREPLHSATLIPILYKQTWLWILTPKPTYHLASQPTDWPISWLNDQPTYQPTYLQTYIYTYLYNNPSYSHILIGSCLWSIKGQTHNWYLYHPLM